MFGYRGAAQGLKIRHWWGGVGGGGGQNKGVPSKARKQGRNLEQFFLLSLVKPKNREGNLDQFFLSF